MRFKIVLVLVVVLVLERECRVAGVPFFWERIEALVLGSTRWIERRFRGRDNDEDEDDFRPFTGLKSC
jgi:hypothetical protein